MAKELPYFRFTAQEWQNGDISLETYELKGIFTDICAYYWVKDCSLTLAMLKKRFNNDLELIDQLFELEIIKPLELSEYIEITFLDEQFDLLSEARKRRQEAGSRGGKSKSINFSNAKAMLKQSASYKDKDKDKINISFEKFWDLYDKKVGKKEKIEKKWIGLSDNIRQQIIDNIPVYKDSQPDKRFRKNPETYLNNDSWDDEIIQNKINGTNPTKSPIQINPTDGKERFYVWFESDHQMYTYTEEEIKEHCKIEGTEPRKKEKVIIKQ